MQIQTVHLMGLSVAYMFEKKTENCSLGLKGIRKYIKKPAIFKNLNRFKSSILDL